MLFAKRFLAGFHLLPFSAVLPQTGGRGGDAEPESPGTPDSRNVSGGWSCMACCLWQECDTREPRREQRGRTAERGKKKMGLKVDHCAEGTKRKKKSCELLRSGWRLTFCLLKLSPAPKWHGNGNDLLSAGRAWPAAHRYCCSDGHLCCDRAILHPQYLWQSCHSFFHWELFTAGCFLSL